MIHHKHCLLILVSLITNIASAAYPDFGGLTPKGLQRGVETKITEREQSGKTVYRVRAGVFKKLDDAEAMKSKLDKAGFDAVLVKAPI